ncbi:50S ribosome-binding GTPase [Streptomyces triculaminicus]|uniref:50S ribosome-binding GTPase n=2 Tax=Streptomyces TaxID=1883 RepID=A0A939FTR0_9ACTN|nr:MULTISPECIES: nucleoside-triphosphatase [Streptomyces]MBO0657167.1 50S ribosome-binding GTPase [Streptomyces triculaminicus]QSY49443.1 50S ribosome-binding GTPase [Streptomyces griseocarneus]
MRILIEGRPGVGKTTAVRALADGLSDRTVTGFTTREMREGGTRVGFVLDTLDGRHGVLAHVDFPGPPRVGRYGVDLGVMEELALPALRAVSSRWDAGGGLPDPVVLIDELGRMELSCPGFQDTVRSLLEAPVDLVATVHVHRDPFTDALKERDDVEVIHLSQANRDTLPSKLAARLQSR